MTRKEAAQILRSCGWCVNGDIVSAPLVGETDPCGNYIMSEAETEAVMALNPELKLYMIRENGKLVFDADLF